jgi:hypothetical protein
MAPAAPLNALVADVAPRFVVEYANTMKFYSVAPPADALFTLLGQTADRVVLQYANANRFYALGYPKAMFNDTTPPQISDLKATVTKTISSTNLVTMTWLTNEVVTTTLEYGFAPGSYTTVLTDVLLFRLHEFGILDVPSGATIYYRIHHLDRSGNALDSDEYSFTVPLPAPTATPTPTATPIPPKRYVYVPLVRK